MNEQKLDWVRLQKALSVEAERGYIDIMGNQYRFSEFLCLSLGKPPKNISLRSTKYSGMIPPRNLLAIVI